MTPVLVNGSKDGININYEHAFDKDISTSLYVFPQIVQNEKEVWLNLNFEKETYIFRVIFYYKFFKHWFSSTDDCIKNETTFIQCIKDNEYIGVVVTDKGSEVRNCGKKERAEPLNDRLTFHGQKYDYNCKSKGDGVRLYTYSSPPHEVKHMVVYEIIVLTTGILIRYCLGSKRVKP